MHNIRRVSWVGYSKIPEEAVQCKTGNYMSTIKKIALLLGDVAFLALALALTLLVRYGTEVFGTSFGVHIGPFFPIFGLWVFVFYLGDLYHPKTLRNERTLLKTLAVTALIAGSISAIAFYLFAEFFKLTPKTNLVLFSAFTLLLVYVWRKTVLSIFSSGALPTAVFGSSPLLEETVAYAKENPQAGFRIVAWEQHPDQNSIMRSISEHGARAVVFEDRLTHTIPSFLQSMFQLLHQEITLISFQSFFELVFQKVPLRELDENWFVENIATRRPFYDAAKRAVDFAFGIILFIALLPLGMVIACAIKTTSRGPVLYTQRRIGKSGNEFTLYKFRTMRVNHGGPLWTERNDARITKIGSFLRATHLDELPQLINIILGSVSFIGPRPERSELAAQYHALPYYEIRHTIKPGLTGWAQINFKPSASLEEAYEKLCFDIYYIKNRSLFLDALIILKTIRYLFSFNHS